MKELINSGLFVIALYVLTLVTWLFYLAVTNLIRIRHQLTGVAKFNGYILVVIGLILDVLVNCIVGTILFLELPREFLLTTRLQRLKRRTTGYRPKLANWLCNNLLNPFDPGHCD